MEILEYQSYLFPSEVFFVRALLATKLVLLLARRCFNICIVVLMKITMMLSPSDIGNISIHQFFQIYGIRLQINIHIFPVIILNHDFLFSIIIPSEQFSFHFMPLECYVRSETIILEKITQFSDTFHFQSMYHLQER